MSPPLLVWGASGHALVVAEIVGLVGAYSLAGFIDDVSLERKGEPFCGATVLGGREALPALQAQGVTHAIVAVGLNEARLAISALLEQHGFALASAVHPRASVAADATMGPGTVVAAGAVVAPGAVFGASVIVNTGATVDHECRIGDGVHIGPGAHLGGRATVGRAAWVGLGALVRDKVAVGAGTVVGMGAVVVGDLPAGVVAYGVPARVIRPLADLDD